MTGFMLPYCSWMSLILHDNRLKNVNDNMESAVEHAPETFGQVFLLYVNCTVNGFAVKAAVDSGKETSCHSPVRSHPVTLWYGVFLSLSGIESSYHPLVRRLPVTLL